MECNNYNVITREVSTMRNVSLIQILFKYVKMLNISALNYYEVNDIGKQTNE